MIIKSSRIVFPIVVPSIRGAKGRLFAAKTADRAAVHGVRQPSTYTLQDREKIEADIDKTKEEHGKQRKETEEKVDSQLKKSDNVVSESPENLSSS